MSVPLASLRRGAMTVHLHDSFGMDVAPASDDDAHVGHRFRRTEEAEAYLRYWAGDAGAVAALRRALARREPGTAAWSNARVFRSLATQLAIGTVVALETRVDLPRVAGESTVAATTQAAAPAAASIPVSPVAPPPAPVVPTLAALEDVQIEGAQVLPEVEQTIEQIDLTMATINLATVSLEPTPSGVPGIGAAMAGASASVTSTLDGL